ncbi:efflux RND transporter periplasmic adaptor subunit [Rhodocytophaga aerolata]|uniref:Efflux RND transporter periplasmic adaptor subunit n=1 Tax=Rhodocytophaga aerolata TaxID=455078 RepID=A0ABT8REQ8_9BACT|nr:efflux RND transporter periplasmic adaptor subunit [Rhodocytophaga aerolata]MDO1449230.1 efflux RND transporter periplasmic adaptor subunit [Rhodocytophaga aerolata]
MFLLAACNPATEKTDHEGHTMGPNQNHATSTVDTSLADIVRSVNQTVISSQETVEPVVKASGSVVKLNGYISEDPMRNQVLSTRVGGRIEKLYVKYNYQYIGKGEKVLDLYSPELRTSQEEYLYLLKSNADENLIKSAKRKLVLLGLSETQINNLEQRDKISLTITIYSPYTGYVILESASPAMTSSREEGTAEGMSMIGDASATSDKASGNTQTNPQLREGAYVNAGQTLFTINDFKKVWALLAVDVEDQSFITENTPVKVVSEVYPDKPIEGKINFIEPVYSEGIQFMQARVYLDNSEEDLKANSLVRAEIQTGSQARMLVPNSSLSDLGGRKIVWVKTKDTPSGKKVFVPRTVLTGIRSDDFTQITEGLNKDEVIAKYAGYLLDSESIVE